MEHGETKLAADRKSVRSEKSDLWVDLLRITYNK
jgi:hypothetical protein